MPRWVLAGWVVMAAVLAWAPGAAAGGVPLRVYETQLWVGRVLQREASHLDLETRRVIARTVAEEAQAHELDPALLMAVMRVESRFRPGAISHRGARGLMQVKPSTAGELTNGTVTAKALHDPETNVRLGATLLKRFIRTHRGNLAEGLAAYNMGSRRLRHLLARDAALKAEDMRYARAVMREAARLKATHKPVQLRADEAPPATLAAWLMD
ncbi:MAG: lytic transglycosylase domain-containing protein [Deltaproteobacteria bacterium]|nr:lytic transglycosylase domain-containing protein [Deltaproteobacteria bacterium]